MASINIDVSPKDGNGQPPSAGTAAKTADAVAKPGDAKTHPSAGGGGSLAPKQKATTCAEFVIGAVDSAGHVIHEIYFKRDAYVIYCTDDVSTTEKSDRRILIKYADGDESAAKQIAEVADLIPQRNKALALLRRVKDKLPYYTQIAEALRLGLEHKPEVGRLILDDVIADLQNVRASEGRNLYVGKALPVAVIGASSLIVLAGLLLIIGGIPFAKAWSPLAHLAIAAGAGALGALLSIAISVRAKTVATDGDDASIRDDALLRVVIGVISAGALYLFLGTGVLSQLKIGEITFNAGAIPWQVALLIGFASGFLERLVPDLLEKAQKK